MDGVQLFFLDGINKMIKRMLRLHFEDIRNFLMITVFFISGMIAFKILVWLIKYAVLIINMVSS